MLARGRAAPARYAAAPWAALAALVGVTCPSSRRSGGRPAGRQWAGLRATGRMPGRGRTAPARCAASPWARLWPRGWTGTWSQLRAALEDGQQAAKGPDGRPRAGRRAQAGRLRRGALRLPGRGSGRADGRAPGSSSRHSEGRPAGRQRAGRKAAGRMPGTGQAAPARRAASPWAALELPMCPTWTHPGDGVKSASAGRFGNHGSY